MKTSSRLLFICSAGLVCLNLSAMAEAQAMPPRAATIDLKFDFSAGPAKAGYQHVGPLNEYSDYAGYGYESGAQVAPGDHGNTTTSDRPFMFSAKVPEGELQRDGHALGDSHAIVTSTTVKAESGRLMLERVEVPSRPDRRTYLHHECTHLAQLPRLPMNAPGREEVSLDQL
jgi:hypothetical protein